jgi:inorganic pyrophosphatase
MSSTAPKKPDPNTGSQGGALASKAPQLDDNANPRYEVVQRGQLHTLNYRCYFRDVQTKTIVSPFHDIPLVNEQYGNEKETIYNMVVEVPRWTNAKMEINKQLKLNPLVQDIKNGKPRFVHNVFPYHGYLWNYGALPQTWEDPNHVDEDTKTTGDNDPLDVCEIGTTLHATGSIIPVKIVGVLGLIDEGETDWKLIGIDIRDKLASQINDINDVETQLPGLLEATRRWFKYYKVPTGKPPNKFALNEQFADREYAQRVIAETRKYWEKLASGETKVDEKVCSIANTTLNNRGTIKKEDAEKIVEADEKHQSEPAKLDASVHQLAYVKDEEERTTKEKKF